jgi:hypothetical protein
VWAVDASRAAVDCTRRNAEKNGVEITAKLGDRFDPVGELLTCLPVDVEIARFESLLSERFRFRPLPEERVEFRRGELPDIEGRKVSFIRSYLAMKL